MSDHQLSTTLDAHRIVIEQVIKDAIGWALTKDTKRLFSIMAHDDDFFIYHPESQTTIHGFDAFRNLAEHAWMNPDFQATDYSVKDLKIMLSESGTVAWFHTLLDDHALWKGQPTGWDNARWTGVLELRGGHWVIVQMHFSFATDQMEKA